MLFKINNLNKTYVFNYLSKKINSDAAYLIHLGYIEKEKHAEEQLNQAYNNAELLDSWCREYLLDEQFKSLRAAIRKQQSRKGSEVTTVELARNIYSDLNDLACHANMTIKDYLTVLIATNYKEINPPVAQRASKRKVKEPMEQPQKVK